MAEPESTSSVLFTFKGDMVAPAQGMEGSLSDELDDNLRDKLVAAGRAAVGLVPYAGGALGEILTAVIPNQRADRIASYLRQLAERLDQLNAAQQALIARSSGKIDLIEEGGYQATRALSSGRISQIVEAVAQGLQTDDVEIVRRKRLLTLFGELDDDEVVLLNAYGQSYGASNPAVWESINRPEPMHFGSGQENIDQNNLFDAGRAHLERLGLLKRTYPFVKRGELPEFDTSKGEFKHSLEISSLGRLLLGEIGMPTPFDSERSGAGD